MATVRRWIRDQLVATYRHPDAVAGDVELIASELVTNSLQAGATTLTLCLDSHHAFVSVATTDDAPGRPVVQDPDPELDHGRGLMIVDALAARWGVADETAGKTVWANVRVDAAAGPDFDCSN